MAKGRYHFIGITGIGMSALAKLLLERGESISGSDPGSSALTKHLENEGAKIFTTHEAHHVENADVVVYSSAIKSQNPELIRAREKGLRILKRGELLAELFNEKSGIAVAGSHGKTTTSSMLGSVLLELGFHPTVAVGGIITHLGSNAISGTGESFVAESDESDGSFLLLTPKHALLTNIDNDHLDHYGSVEALRTAFEDFLARVPAEGKVIVNGDDPGIRGSEAILSRAITFGLQSGQYRGSDLQCSASGSDFKLTTPVGETYAFSIAHLGRHNVLNALGVITLCLELGLTPEKIQRGLSVYRGVGRRLERLLQRNGFTLLDDYGHHPTEIRTTIASIKEVDPRPLTILFEPHRYTRTKNFWDDFVECFSGADKVYILPIYAASESALPEITSEKLVEAQRRRGIAVEFLPELSGMKGILLEEMKKDSVLLTLGAGGISKTIRSIVDSLPL